MLPEVLAAGISSGANIGGGFLTSILNNNSNKKIARENREFAYQQWLRENEYNLPSNQVQRLKDAGLNPALALGSITPGNAQSSAVPERSPSDFSPIMQGITNAGSILSQAELVRSESRKNTADASLSEYNQSVADQREKRAIEVHLLDLEERRARIDGMDIDSQHKKKMMSLLDEQIASASQDREFLSRSFDERLRAIKLQNNKVAADTALAKAQSEFINVQKQYYPAMTQAQIANIQQSIALTYQQAQNAIVDGRLTSAKELNQYLQNNLQKMINEDTAIKRGVRDGSPVTKTLYHFSDYVGSILSAPLKGLLK